MKKIPDIVLDVQKPKHTYNTSCSSVGSTWSPRSNIIRYEDRVDEQHKAVWAIAKQGDTIWGYSSYLKGWFKGVVLSKPQDTLFRLKIFSKTYQEKDAAGGARQADGIFYSFKCQYATPTDGRLFD